ncbi:MAG: LacI family DNA-binding transcriptional regulator [Bacteroidota bacterium]
MPGQKEVTIYDLAKELNLSAATISRGLKDSPSISKATCKRIQALAAKRGFQINSFARNLRQNKTHIIGVMMHELNTSFMVSVLSGIEKVLGKTEYDILIAHSAEQGETEITNARNLFQKRVDGVIASLALDTPNLDHFNCFTEKNIPVVYFDRVEEQGGGAKIVVDNYNSGYQVTEHLIKQGCKSIVHLTSNLARNVYKRRYDGYRAALSDYNIPFRPEQLIVCHLDEANSRAATTAMLKMNPKPDGLFAAGDFAASICILALKEKGIKVPEDIAVAGFNNDAVSTIIEPHLTTVNYSGFTMGEIAARLILDHLNGKQDISITNTIIMNAELIVRPSSQRIKSAK